MEYINAMEPIEQETPKPKKEDKKSISLFDMAKTGMEVIVDIAPTPEPPKPKRKKKTTTSSTAKKEQEKSDETSSDLPMYQSNVSYKTEYEETDDILKETLAQLNDLSMDIKDDIITIKQSKTMKSKYTYLTNLYSSYGSVLSAKVSAVREMNSSTTKAVELDLRRAKELHLTDKVDDDKAVMDMYKSIISIPKEDPMSLYSAPISYSQMQTLYPSAVFPEEDALYNNYVNNMTPEQKLMRLEGDPNIQTVVIFNKDTFEKRFAVMNIATGEEITGVPCRSTEMFMPDTTIDEANGIARNINLNETYKLIVVGGNNIENYY